MKTYIEIREIKTERCVHRLDVTGKSERTQTRVADGMSINLHDDFEIVFTDYETDQPTGDIE